MDPDRWRQIERLYHSALEKEPSERSSFLTLSCGTDIRLRREVESLLAVASEPDDSLNSAAPPAVPEAGSGARSAPPPVSGQFTATRKLGRYELLEQVGKGGMGVVYRAVDPAIGRTVAIKTILLDASEEGQNPELRSRLLRESQAGGQLSHPNIVAVYDVSEQGDTAYIVMEYVVGRTLEQAVALDPSVRSFGEILRIVQDCANALDYAHSRGVVHRDIKPANIMLQAGGAVKIADFGIAKAAQFTPLTQSSVILGSPHYMAPEQWRGEGVTGRTDQYALAAVAYALLTGRRPFEGDTTATLATKVLYEEPPAATSLNPSLPPDLDNVFRRALAKTPSERFETCGQFAGALRTAIERAAAAPIAPVVAIAPVGPNIPTAPAPAAPPATRSGFNWVAAVLGLAILIAAAAGFWLYQRNSTAQLEIAYWTSIKDSKTSAPFEEYLTRYPAGQFAGQAQAQLDALKSQQPPQSTPPVTAKETKSPAKVSPTKAPEKSPPASERTPVVTTPKPPPPPAIDPFIQAQVLSKGGDYEGALPYFSQAVALHPDYRSYFGRAGAYQHLERLDQSIADYTQAIGLDPSSAMAFHERAICRARLNQDERALTDFNRALELSPDYALSWNGRGVIFLHRNQYRKALADFNEAIRINPNLFQAYKNRAVARRALGDMVGANADVNQANRLKQ